jgi:hypothetical protein
MVPTSQSDRCEHCDEKLFDYHSIQESLSITPIGQWRGTKNRLKKKVWLARFYVALCLCIPMHGRVHQIL